MPEVMIRKLGPFNKETNPELICETCRQYKEEEELDFTALIFPHPEDDTKMVSIALNVCKTCINEFIVNSPMNRVKDTFSVE